MINVKKKSLEVVTQTRGHCAFWGGVEACGRRKKGEGTHCGLWGEVPEKSLG